MLGDVLKESSPWQPGAKGVLPFVSVCEEPPYRVEESGYAGFILPIEIYFRNKVRLG